VNTYVYRGRKTRTASSSGGGEGGGRRNMRSERDRANGWGGLGEGGGRGRAGGRRGNRGKEAGGWIFQAAPPWQRSQRIAMATDPETPSGRRATIASERASLSDGSNNVSSLLQRALLLM